MVLQACQITSPAGTTFTAGQAGTFTVTSTGMPNCGLSETGALPTGVTFKDNKDGTATLSGTPAAGSGGLTRSRSPRRTVSVLTPPRPSPSRSTRRARSPATTTPPLPSARPGPLPSRRPGCPLRLVRVGRSAAGSHVHGQRGRHRDTLGNTGDRRRVPAHDHRHERYRFCRHPGLHPHRSTRRPGSPAPTTPPVTVGQACDLYRHRRPGCPTPGLSETGSTADGSHVHGQRGRHGDTCGNTDAYRRYVHVHDHRHERCRF